MTRGPGQGRSRAIAWAMGAVCMLAVSGPAVAGPTYYVDGDTGDDARSATQAEDAGTPWRTINRAMSAGGLIGVTKKGVPLAGYTVVVAPGLYAESVESKRDGLPGDPVVIRAATPGTVTVKPPAGKNGFFVSHHDHVIEGFVVTGGANGLKLGPHDGGDGPVHRLVARANAVHGNTNNGIQFANAQDGQAVFNIVAGNAKNGINYSGHRARIHDNEVRDNGQIGIYVRDGVDHQVWNNLASGNGAADVKVLGTQLPPPGGRTFFVGPAGSDAHQDVQAQNPATPWASIRRGLLEANPGDTVAVLPGTYAAPVESVRDGAPGAPITLRAVEPGAATIAPATGAAVVVSHHHHVVEGLVVTGGSTGLKLGPYKKTGGEVHELVVRGNWVYGNGTGIKFTNVVSATAVHNEVWDNRREGIAYLWANQGPCPPESRVTIFNNLVVNNGLNLSGEYGVTVGCGTDSVVASNTVWGNANGGLRIGVAGDVPVGGQVVNNIIGGSPVGYKEPAGDNYQGQVRLDFNNVHGNAVNYALGPRTRPGPGSISLPPGFVDAAGGDFALGRVATGQPQDSPAIDRGSDTAEAVGLAGRTAFTDKYPDSGRVDLGYHATLLVPAEGALAVSQAAVTLSPGGMRIGFAATFTPGAGSDGIEAGVDYIQVSLVGVDVYLWPAGFARQGAHWVYQDATGATTGVLDALADGRVALTVTATGLPSVAVKTPTSVSVRFGDDHGSGTLLLQGTLQIE